MQKLVYPSLRDGLVAAWCPSIDRSRSSILTDLSGYGNHGKLTQMDPATDWVASENKIALDFDGTDDYALVDSPFPTMSAVSVSAWIKWTATGNYGSIVTKASQATWGGTYCDWGMRFTLDSRIEWSVGYNSASSINYSLTHLNTLSGWIHLCGTYDTEWLVFHVNGKEDGYTQYLASLGNNGFPLYIGSRQELGEFYSGKIDDVRIYNREITPSEVSTLAQRRGIAYETYRMPVVRGASVAATSIPIFAHHYRQQGVV